MTELLSLLQDPVVMAKENTILGYDVLAGKSAEGEFLDPTTLGSNNLNTIPVPNNSHRAIGEIYCYTTFQGAVKQYYSEDHHMPVPIIMYYDKAHVDCNGALGAFPFLAAIDFIRVTSRHLLSNWRFWGYVPKLDNVERSWSSTMDAIGQ